MITDVAKREKCVAEWICPDCGSVLVAVKEALNGVYVSDANNTAVRCSAAIEAEKEGKDGCVFVSYLPRKIDKKDSDLSGPNNVKNIQPPSIDHPGIDEIAAENTSRNKRIRREQRSQK